MRLHGLAVPVSDDSVQELSQREQFRDDRRDHHVSCEQVIPGQEPGSKQMGSVPVRTIWGNYVGGEGMLRNVCLRWSMIFLSGAVFTMVMSALPAQAEMPAQTLLAEINGEAITVEHLGGREKGTGYFNFGGRPRRRNVDSSPSAVAICCCHVGVPKGCWRFTQVRSAVSSWPKSG